MARVTRSVRRQPDDAGGILLLYDVVEGPEPTVEVLAIVSKKEATVWLEREERES